MRDYYSQDAVLPIYIEVEDGVRLQRALDRERCRAIQSMRKCADDFGRCRRFFQGEIAGGGIHRIFYNEDLECTEEDIVCFMREVMMSEEG